MTSQSSALAVLREVASIPTAPLHEERVAAYVRGYLQNLGLPPRVDQFGNLIAEYRNGETPRPVALVAHLDHPALEIQSFQAPTNATAALLGGVPAGCFDRPVPVRVFTGSGEVGGTNTAYYMDATASRIASIRLRVDAVVAPGDFAVFDLPDFQEEGDWISLRVADDLAGVAAALLTMANVVEQRRPGVVYGVFTRAEEIGLVGANLVAEEGSLPPETIVISLECSRELPGAKAGQGPVIRVGDRTRSFSPEGEALLLQARETIPGVPVQRQLMSGGTCEVTAFGARGYRATGVALPLINYHNVGEWNIIAPERINARDFLGEVALLTAAVAVAPHPELSTAERLLAEEANRYREQLKATADRFGT